MSGVEIVGLNVGIYCLLSLIIGAAIVFWWQDRRRQAAIEAVNQEKSALSVAESQLADLNSRLSKQAEELRITVLARNELSTSNVRLQSLVEQGDKKILELSAEKSALAGELRKEQTTRSNAEADSRVASSRALSVSDDLKMFRGKCSELEQDRMALSERIAVLTGQSQGLTKECEGLRQQLVDQRIWIEEQTVLFERKVLAAASTMMEDRGKASTESNRKEVDAVIAPFKEKLEDFRRRVDEIHSIEATARGQLDEKIVSLTNLNRTVSDQADRLVKALTVSSKFSGDWGETILAKILEDSGLRRERDYKLQVPIKGVNGEDYRPDAILYLPDDRQLVVDSKVSNKAWTEYCAESDDTRRESLFREHLASIRAHIKGLSGKNYAASPDLKTVDFVLMFVPVEAALLAALVKDDSLYADAYAQRIILVTPTTLMAVVRMTLGLWTFQTRMESVEEIVEVGRKLYEKLSNFAETFVEVGKSISDTQQAYEKAKGQLSTGRGNALRIAEQLRELGVTPSAGKTIPAGLLRGSEGDVSGFEGV